MRISALALAVILSLSILAASCRQAEPRVNQNVAEGSVVLWTADNGDGEVWENVIGQFSQIYPDVTVLHTQIPPDQLQSRYENTVAMGLGPDLVVAPSDWLSGFAERGLVRPIGDNAINLESYLSAAIGTLVYNDQLYGLPLSLEHNALYYNKDLVETPAATLDELLAQAEAGQIVALPSTFEDAFWGVPAFGGHILDDQGLVAFHEGAMTNWLSWLWNVQKAPGIILNRDKSALRELFMNGAAAYYIGGPSELAQITEVLGEERVGVAVLPGGPQGDAGPLLRTQGVLFNPHSAAEQARLAELLAEFVTNAEQSSTFMRAAGIIPANNEVLVDARVFPAIAGFSAQARTAVSLPSSRETNTLMMEGETLFRTVLAGVQTPREAVVEFTDTIVSELGLPSTREPATICGPAGELQIWHSLSKGSAQALKEIAADYQQACPKVVVLLEQVDADAIEEQLAEASLDQRPQLILTSASIIPTLADAEIIQPINDLLSDELQQRFVPIGLLATAYQDKQYGLPFSLSTNVLYFNSDLVSDAPVSLETLPAQIDTDRRFVFPINTIDAFWGIPAFSTELIDEEGRLLTDVSGLIGWLQWLLEQKDSPGMEYVLDGDVDPAAALADDLGYLLGRSDDLQDLETVGDAEALQSSLLLSGPEGPGRSLLSTQTFLVSGMDDVQKEAGMAFATYATALRSQTNLMWQARQVPANTKVSTAGLAEMAVLRAQAQEAVVLPAQFSQQWLVEFGDQMYASVLSGEATPEEAACNFVLAINQAAGFEITPEELGDVCIPAEDE